MSVTNTPTIESRTRPRETAAQLLSVEEARARVVAAMPLLESEPVDLKHARGRVTAEDVRAGRDHPAAAISAMDGYALRLADVTKLPVRLRKIGVSRAGAHFDSPLLPGCCVRIFTGATVPAGADTIALQEDASEDGQEVEIRSVGRVSQHIRAAGLDFAAGQVCVARGRALTARDIGVIASCGYTQVIVRRTPRVGVLSTGDELVELGVPPGPDQIIGSNSPALTAALASWGAEAADLGIVADRADVIADAVDRAAGADILVITGGASVGEHDLVRSGVALRGFVVDFWRITMRPGKPLM